MVNTINLQNESATESARPVTPLGILTEHLQAAATLLAPELKLESRLAEADAHVQQALKLAAGLDPYVERSTTAESAALRSISEKTRQEAWKRKFSEGSTVRQLEQEMLSGHVEGQTLKMFVYMSRAQRVLDIGMFTGYSALAMAEALPENGRLIACEVDAYVASFAEALFQESPHGSKIEIKLNPALVTLNQLAAAEDCFDLVFIDADKREYVQYFQLLLDANLLAPNGFICVDNTLLQGQPYLPAAERSENGEAIAQFNQVVADDPRVEQVLLPIRDGLTIIRRV
ncbi:class I SAM-dependent methyltransferase [Phormidium tenue FACHB-886]|nr:class I SAM-dependent methyltransferase [Phormidium tenue FACHB-886]